MNHRDFQRLATIRAKEALILLEQRQYSGTYYLSGYVAECALKACIAKHVRRHEFPDRKRVNDSYTHDLERLVGIAGLASDLDEMAKSDPEFARNWAIAKDWKEDSRYERVGKRTADGLYSAITDHRHGVLPWLQRFW